MSHSLRQARSLHRALVPFAALPLILTASTGVIFSVLEQQGIEAEWLLDLHSGRFGPLNLQPYYADLLGVCVLILVITGARLWWRQRRSHASRP